MGKFGWSYPPGCDGPPEPVEEPCEICGLDVHECECPPCRYCGVVGDPCCFEGKCPREEARKTPIDTD